MKKLKAFFIFKFYVVTNYIKPHDRTHLTNTSMYNKKGGWGRLC